MLHTPPKRTFSSREFNQDVAGAKRAARQGPVTITDRGRAAFILMTNEQYERLLQPQKSIVEMLAQHGPEADFDFEPARLGDNMGFRIPSFDED